MISLANLSNLEEYRLGFSAATIHDLFNWCSIILLLPVEMGTGMLEKISGAIITSVQETGTAVSEESFLLNFHSLFNPIINSLVVLKSQGKHNLHNNDQRYISPILRGDQ